MCVYFKTHWRPSNQMTRHSSHAWNILMGEPLFLLHIFWSIFKRMFFEQLWKIQLDSLLKTNATPKLKPLVKEGKMFYWAIFWRQTFLNRIMLSAQFLGGGVSVFSLLTTILSYMSPLLPPSTHVCKATELANCRKPLTHLSSHLDHQRIWISDKGCLHILFSEELK